MKRYDKRDRSARCLLLLALSLVAVMALSACTSSSQADASAASDMIVGDQRGTDQEGDELGLDERQPLPLLLDLGATSCIPCKMMAPILEELAETKKDYFEVLFIDVWENRDEGREYGVSAIPTQIFFAANGEELYRHIGFYSREEIMSKWRDLGIEVGE